MVKENQSRYFSATPRICHASSVDFLLAGSGSSILTPLASSQHNLYDIYILLCVQCLTPDDGQRNCP